MPDHIICDVDGTLLNGSDPIAQVIAFLDERPEPVCIVTGRKESERADTVAALAAAVAGKCMHAVCCVHHIRSKQSNKYKK